MRVLELFSGIGGMHLALKDSGVKGEVVVSVDINTTANLVYKHNFSTTVLLNRNIQSLTSKYINELNIDTLLMSPPCQPFTRNGLKEDIKDARTVSFLHVLNILPELNVQNILIENVKGFEASEMRLIMIKTLENSGFVFQEFVLSPTQFGIPNTRHRYYCISKKLPSEFKFKIGPMIEDLPSKYLKDNKTPYNISEILEIDGNLENYSLSDVILQKRATVLDICYSNSSRSCCFTKAYGRYVTGTGSVYTSKTKEEVDCIYKELENYNESTDTYLKCVKKLELRFFTPREVCRLMSFPESFSFPQNVTDRQKYMLLGNSVNIRVVSQLIKIMAD